MPTSVLKSLLMLVAALMSLAAPVAWAQPVQQAHIELELVAEGSAAPGSVVHVALRQKIEDGWHTYWVNPGDAGGPPKLEWTLPSGWSAGEIIWPVPERLPYLILMNYGYSGEVFLPVPVSVPGSASVGSIQTLSARVDYQVCSDICIPGTANLSVPVRIEAAPSPDATHGAAVRSALAKAPVQADLRATFARQGETLRLSVAGPALAGADFARAYFFPFDSLALKHVEPQLIEKGPEGLTLTLAAYNGPQGPLEGVLQVGDRAYQIVAPEGGLIAEAAGAGTLPAWPMPGEDAANAAAPSGLGGLLLMALAAFGGGLILNLMPCVFPILSMKAASIADHGEHPRAARVQGLVFMAGVLVTFLALAGVLIAVRAAGSSVGWGFQLQSPDVTAALTIIMLLVALNLAGVFEIGMSVQGAGSGLAHKAGLIGAFFTGVLAVVVAAPCTAPFMGPAIAYALTQPPIAALTVFAGLALGFAAPLVLFTFIPPLLRLIPRPGAWMATFKTILSFPMFGAAAWLAWVFTGQQGQDALAGLLAASILVALGAWLFGHGQRSPKRAKRWALQAALPLALLLSIPIISTLSAAPVVAREDWSAERVSELRAEGKVVFVDFTADWCVSCKVNEGTALASKKVAQAFGETGAVYLVGDWTNRDDVIAAELARHGRVGVPLYLVYGPMGDPEILPQLLTAGTVADALRRAADAPRPVALTSSNRPL